MTPSISTGRLLARSLSHGGIAGAVVGSVVGATLIFLLILPFILRCLREHRYRKRIAQENAEMGIADYHVGPNEPYRPPFIATAHTPGGSGPPTQASADATATLGDNNSSDDGGKVSAAASPKLTSAAPAAAPADVPAAAARSPTDTASPSTPTTTSMPANAYAYASPPQTPPRVLNPAHTFPIQSLQDQLSRPRQRSSTMRSARPTSLSQSLEGFAGRLFRQGSHRSTPSRSSTMQSSRGPAQQLSRSPVEISFDHLDPVNHHTWLMRQQGIEDSSTGVEPGFFEVDYNNLTGASAEYYSGMPLSPPTDPSSSYMAPISYASSPPSMVATHLASMASAAGVAGVASSSSNSNSSSRKPPKPIVTRTDSLRSTASGTDFSPLPMSPTSPLPKVHEGSESGDGDGDGQRGVVEIEAEAVRAMSSSTLSPEPAAESMQRSPSHHHYGLVPSPRLPAPGTVNPMDVWAPATEDERFIHKTAELDRIEQSPSMHGSQSGSVDATDVSSSSRASSASPNPNEFLVDDDMNGVGKVPPEATPAATSPCTQPTPTSHYSPSPKEEVAAPEAVADAVSPQVKIEPAGDDDQATPIAQPDEAARAPAPAPAEKNTAETSQVDAVDLEEFMGDDYEDGINYAFENGSAYGYAPEEEAGAAYPTTVTPATGTDTAADTVQAPQTLPQQPETMSWSDPVAPVAPVAQVTPAAPMAPVNAPVNMSGQMDNDVSGQMHNDVSGQMPYAMPPAMPPAMQAPMPTMMHNPMQSSMQSNMQNNMQPSMQPMMHQMPAYMVPNQGDYSNSMMTSPPFPVPANGYADMSNMNNMSNMSMNNMNNMNNMNSMNSMNMNNMNNINGMHAVNYNNSGAPSHYSLHTPQSSPGQYAVHHMDGAAPQYPQQQNLGLPLTPPLHGMTNFNSPLSVPGYDGLSGPVSPLSNQGSSAAQSPRSYACEKCGRAFDQVHKLNHHKRYHERPHECAVAGCGKRFGTKTHLDRHINDKHSKSRKYHCTEMSCPYSVTGGKSFPRKDNWRRHMVNKHGVQPEHDPIEVVDQPMMGM